jgi:Flp pilus assembly secretin CpaC
MRKLFGLAIAMLSLSVPGALAAERIEVSLGHSQVIGPVHQMSTVIVGNDGVVSATLGGGGTIILTGKHLGATNLIVLDENGRELLASELHVVPFDRRPTTNIRIVKGMSQAQTYSCEPATGCVRVGQAAPSGVAMTDETGDTTPEATKTETVPGAAPEEAPEPDETSGQEQISLNQQSE